MTHELGPWALQPTMRATSYHHQARSFRGRVQLAEHTLFEAPRL